MRNFSSGAIQHEMLTITSEDLYSEDQFERKFQAKISPFEKYEESLISIQKFKGKYHDVLKNSSELTVPKWNSWYHLWSPIFWILLWEKNSS